MLNSIKDRIINILNSELCRNLEMKAYERLESKRMSVLDEEKKILRGAELHRQAENNFRIKYQNYYSKEY